MRPLRGVLVVLLLLLPITAAATGRLVYRVGLEPPAEILSKEGPARLAFAEAAAQRLKQRLAAAGVKDAELRVASPSTVLVETGWEHERAWMEALLTSPGQLELRLAMADRPNWLELAAQIPAGIELRGERAPYLWAPSRSTLQGFLGRVQQPGVYLTVFPDEGGFRSVSLGDVLATHKQIRSAHARRSPTGASFVAVDFENAVGASLAAAHVPEVELIALVLDGELIAFVPARAFFERTSVRISVPEGAVPDDRTQRDLWIRQVAGRLAAPLPVAIAVLKE